MTLPSFFTPLLFCVILLNISIGCKRTEQQSSKGQNDLGSSSTELQRPLKRSRQARYGTVYRPHHSDTKHLLEVHWVNIPDFPGTSAIWGATGRDDSGCIYLGVSTVWTPQTTQPSAHVFCFEPVNKKLKLLGDVIDELRKTGDIREANLKLNPSGKILPSDEGGTATLCRESQMKVHSKFITMDDGWTYFTSMDEWNEQEDGSQLPFWGSHLWRYRSSDNAWEKLADAPEGLIAVCGVERYLFALGYYGHVVYRYDTQTGDWIHKEIGSYQGHISRNFIANRSGHVFVPRVSQLAKERVKQTIKKPDNSNFKVELVELDHNLNEVHATKIKHYSVTGNSQSHGLTSFTYLKNEKIIFTTATGFLYQIISTKGIAAEVQELGWFHPDGKSYSPSLFPLDGNRFVCGVTKKKDNSDYEWVIYDLTTGNAEISPFNIPNKPSHGIKDLLLYGSNTRDEAGNFYVVGCYKTADGKRQLPICLQVALSTTP